MFGWLARSGLVANASTSFAGVRILRIVVGLVRQKQGKSGPGELGGSVLIAQINRLSKRGVSDTRMGYELARAMAEGARG